MEFTVRPATREDAQQMLQLYNGFTENFVGSATRTVKTFRRMLGKKEHLNWVTLDNQNRIIGYVHARLDKRFNRGEFREIIVDSKHDFIQVGKQLVEKVNAAFTQKKVSAIRAGSLRNPEFEKLFRAMGFFESDSGDVFMYTILDVQKFLDELSPVFSNRLMQLKNWKGLAQIECEGHSLFLNKTSESVQQIVWTNQPIDFKIKLNKTLLTKLIFGIADPVESHKTGQLEVETTPGQEHVSRLLKALFPKKQFLIMDYW